MARLGGDALKECVQIPMKTIPESAQAAENVNFGKSDLSGINFAT